MLLMIIPTILVLNLEHWNNEKKNEGSKEDAVSLFVYVKTPIDWKYEERPKGKELMWTKEDVEKYGNLTVVAIKVIEH
ncbi:hypothetical protein LPB87_17415 [Flavobacterium sp. EDS]|uniref:hypothetical protein n=1 Tax=Flavobacterium sp. EDS TaxID=2897328 RepID=UPI001E5F446D|nr:hypothetical protein [Flavobacterium sp. EDS]MCD0476175.1 hypothetical protein [Flavobacterium sp. EDS]